jgi:thiamine-phosphate pyrophosphorylase
MNFESASPDMSTSPIPKLYAITHAGGGLSHVAQVERFAAAGVRLIQIRDKRAHGRELYEITVAALKAAEPHGTRIVVNDRIDVAVAASAHGVHLGQDDLPAAVAREMLGPWGILGVSTHSAEQAAEAARLPVDYVAIGPIFHTATKDNAEPVVGLKGVAAARAVVTKSLVAIGGITLDTAHSVLEAGADAVAVVSDLRVGPTLEERVRRYLVALG